MKYLVAWLDYEDFYIWSSYDTKEEAEQELERIKAHHQERDRWEISHWSVVSVRHGWKPELNPQETPWVFMMRADEKERVEQRKRQEEG